MKVILLRDVARLGRKHEVKEVPDGHAQNYLIPHKFAEAATPQNLKRLEERAAHVEAAQLATVEQLDAIGAALADKTVVVTAGANAKEHLFKALPVVDIAAAISAASGITVSADTVVVAKPIKSLGAHTVQLVGAGAKREVSISVEAA